MDLVLRQRAGPLQIGIGLDLSRMVSQILGDLKQLARLDDEFLDRFGDRLAFQPIDICASESNVRGSWGSPRSR